MINIQTPTSVVQFDTAAWHTAVKRVSELAHARLPEALHGRVERATALAINGDVWVEEDGITCSVRNSAGGFFIVNGHCECEDYKYAPENLCKHRLSKMIRFRAAELLRTGVIEAPVTESSPTASEPVLTTKVPPQYVVIIQGKRYIRYAGLLYLAHQRGLVSLKARFISVTPELALAEAEATFADGKVFVEAADSTPTNCGPQVRQHYPRMALVRCKARALRDALNLGDLCTVEELSEGD